MAAPSSSDASANPDESFTKMNNKDVDLIGAHCQYTYCNQLDFLPFRCESCKGTFCLDHRTENGHKCPKSGEWAAARRKAASSSIHSTSLSQKPTLASGSQCSHTSCKTYINTFNSVGVTCQNCNRQYCLKHRMREDHDCAKLTPLGARSSDVSQAERPRTALGRLKAWSREKQSSVTSSIKPKPSPTSAAARLAATNQLKKTAKGDEKVPPEKRVYLHVEAEASTTSSKLPRGEFWYSREWSVGRMLDAAAKGLQVANVNNRVDGEEEKLRVFHVEAGRLLEFAEKVGDCCVTGNTVVLLRGVGPAAS